MKSTEFKDKPVFICGIPRSGTTLLANILQIHSSFKPRNLDKSRFKVHKFLLSIVDTEIIPYIKGHFPSERLFGKVYNNKDEFPFWRYQFLERDELFEEFMKESRVKLCLNMSLRTVAIRRIFRGQIVKRITNSAMFNKVLWSLAGKSIFRNFLFKRAEALGQQRILEKTPQNCIYLREIFWAFPQAHIIYIYRHPVDIYTSMKRMLLNLGNSHQKYQAWLRMDEDEFCGMVRCYHQAICNMTATKHAAKILLVKYENLCNMSKGVLGETLNFLEEKYESACIQGEKPIRDKNRVFPLLSNVPVPNSGLWSDVLNKESVVKIQSRLSDYMQELGYEAY